ncbi:MAG: hypothetical protein NTW87_07880 [Planctomycetota bacterium]|nr:hypothetical protein [Planctomycetota bacterium]
MSGEDDEDDEDDEQPEVPGTAGESARDCDSCRYSCSADGLAQVHVPVCCRCASRGAFLPAEVVKAACDGKPCGSFQARASLSDCQLGTLRKQQESIDELARKIAFGSVADEAADKAEKSSAASAACRPAPLPPKGAWL